MSDTISTLQLAKLLADVDDLLRAKQHRLHWWQRRERAETWGARALIAAIIKELGLQSAANLAHSPFGELIVQLERAMEEDR